METRKSVVEKVTSYVGKQFGGTDEQAFKRAFDFSDTDKNGLLNLDEISGILADAGVGFRLSRWAIAKEICDTLDSNNDGLVSWEEFASVFRATHG